MIIVRHANLSDTRAIATVHVTSWQVIYRGLIPNQILENLSIEERENLWIQLLKNNVQVLVLEEERTIIGFISYGSGRDQDVDASIVAEITAIYLNPNQWRKGYGTLLLNTALANLTEQGYQQVNIWALDSNQQARNFYEGLGFTASSDSRVEQEDGYSLREIRYWKAII